MSPVNPDPLTLTFFIHDNHSYPPSLSDHGNLRIDNKPDLFTCLESHTRPVSDSPLADTVMPDGPAAVHTLLPNGSKMFKDYVTQVFVQYLRKQLQNGRRVDLVLDVYLADS